ncbi:MAG: hypothetical protein ACRDH8_15430 [Actinomycetota bacterium]
MSCLRHQVAADFAAVTAAPPGELCRAIVEERPRSGVRLRREVVLCRCPATVYVGFLACDEHGAKSIADRVAAALDRALGLRHHTRERARA